MKLMGAVRYEEKAFLGRNPFFSYSSIGTGPNFLPSVTAGLSEQ
jgi:hypothetical protein